MLTFSLVIPVYNESNYIANIFDFIRTLNSRYNEVIFIDGESTDNTVALLSEFKSGHPNVLVISNKNRYVSYALNLAIPLCTGNVIIRLDAHSIFDLNYIDSILDVFKKTDADIVGGGTRLIGENIIQRSIRVLVSSGFGMGNSTVHKLDYKGWTDTVTFGAWKSSVFEKIGCFDVDLIRNQDDEFHYRAFKYGLKIYQDPSIKLSYIPRNSLLKLFHQYYQYGLYKPLVLKKTANYHLRHFVPGAFVLYCIILFFCTSFISIIPLLFYYALLLFYLAKDKITFNVILASMYVAPVIHLSYGFGFLFGIFKLGKNKLKY